MTSRLDCCRRCESEEDTENTKLDRHVDAYTKCEGTGDISTVDECQCSTYSRERSIFLNSIF